MDYTRKKAANMADPSSSTENAALVNRVPGKVFFMMLKH